MNNKIHLTKETPRLQIAQGTLNIVLLFTIYMDTAGKYTRTLHILRGGNSAVKIAVSSGVGGVVTSGSVTSR